MVRAIFALLASFPALAAEPSLVQQAQALFKPLPLRLESDANPITPEKVALGRQLFFERRLSKNQDVSCNSCHDLARYGVDGARFSTGHKGQKGGRNAPTVYNAGHHLAQFWDGRAATLEDQAKGPVLNPIEMALPDAASVERVLRSVPGYAPLFAAAFPAERSPVSFENAAKAIGAYERTLVTPSRFDRFVSGDEKALTPVEQDGLKRFIANGCAGCHNGEGVGGAMYQKLGLVAPYPGLKDEGRVAITHQEADRFFFRVPSLRNVTMTAPYLHDGSVAKLDEMVVLMGRHQLGRELPREDVAAIVSFLGALTGQLPDKALIGEPKPLAKGQQTPPPDPS